LGNSLQRFADGKSVEGERPERFADRTKTDLHASATYDSPPSTDVTILDVMTPQELADFGKRMRELDASKASTKLIEAGDESEEKSSADE